MQTFSNQKDFLYPISSWKVFFVGTFIWLVSFLIIGFFSNVSELNIDLISLLLGGGLIFSILSFYAKLRFYRITLDRDKLTIEETFAKRAVPIVDVVGLILIPVPMGKSTYLAYYLIFHDRKVNISKLSKFFYNLPSFGFPRAGSMFLQLKSKGFNYFRFSHQNCTKLTDILKKILNLKKDRIVFAGFLFNLWIVQPKREEFHRILKEDK